MLLTRPTSGGRCDSTAQSRSFHEAQPQRGRLDKLVQLGFDLISPLPDVDPMDDGQDGPGDDKENNRTERGAQRQALDPGHGEYTNQEDEDEMPP